MYAHFESIANSVKIPIIIYNIPPRSVVDMSVDTMARLFELKNIIGVKDATANLDRVDKQKKKMGPDPFQLGFARFEVHGQGRLQFSAERKRRHRTGSPCRL